VTYNVDVLADSVGPHGIRLTTIEATFPRPYIAELNTHRMLSRNSESSRAIPTELQLERVMKNPYIPEFRERVKGMGGGNLLGGPQRTRARCAWLAARDAAVQEARALLRVAKDDANRLLEPFMWHTAIITATDWDNFLNLRDHPDAALPMQRLARLVRVALKTSTPEPLEYGEWHVPLVEPEEYIEAREVYGQFRAPRVSAGRCARSSYSTHHSPETADASDERWARLSKSGHWSPGEHPARCERGTDYIGNFRGWKQLRKCYPGEAVFPEQGEFGELLGRHGKVNVASAEKLA
jgi:hypothetical protein